MAEPGTDAFSRNLVLFVRLVRRQPSEYDASLHVLRQNLRYNFTPTQLFVLGKELYICPNVIVSHEERL